MPDIPKLPRKSSKRKRGRFTNGGTTDAPPSVEDICLAEATPSVEATLPAKTAITTENPISKPTEDTSKSQPVEVVWPTFKHPCRVRSGIVPLKSDPMFRRTLGERIKITVSSGNGSGGGGHRQQQHQQDSSSETSRPTTKVFFLHKRLLCEYSEYFGAALSPRNRDVFVEAETGHFVFDDDDVDDPDDFHRWAVWLYVCSGCKLSPVFKFQYEHRCRPSRLESGQPASKESSSESGATGEGADEPYGLPQPPPCVSLSDHVRVDQAEWRRVLYAFADEEGEGDVIDSDQTESMAIHPYSYGYEGSVYSTVTGWFCARKGASGGGATKEATTCDPNAPLEAAAAYMFGYRIMSREYRLFALAQFIQHVDLLTNDYKDELRNLLYEVFLVGSEAHRFLTAWVAWLYFKKRLTPEDRFEPHDERGELTIRVHRQMSAYLKMFNRLKEQIGWVDPRRYPLLHWEEDCGKEALVHVDCVHILSLKHDRDPDWWVEEMERTVASQPPDLTEPPTVAYRVPDGRISDQPAEDEFKYFVYCTKAIIKFWAWVLSVSPCLYLSCVSGLAKNKF